MSGAYCLLRLGAPHEGHAHLVEQMLAGHPGETALVLVGSSDVVGRPDVPLPWEERREILRALLAARGTDARRLTFAPLTEIALQGFTLDWFLHVTAAVRAAAGAELVHYYFGDDYRLEDFALLRELVPQTVLHRIARVGEKSGSELRRAIASRDPLLTARYARELACYPAGALARIASAGAE